jgi:hypothetical protein
LRPCSTMIPSSPAAPRPDRFVRSGKERKERSGPRPRRRVERGKAMLSRGAVGRAAHRWLDGDAAAARGAAPFGNLGIFVYAVLAGLVVWLVGLALSQVLRDTRQPSGATLMAAIVLALAGALLVGFRGSLPVELRSATRALSGRPFSFARGPVGLRAKALSSYAFVAQAGLRRRHKNAEGAQIALSRPQKAHSHWDVGRSPMSRGSAPPH